MTGAPADRAALDRATAADWAAAAAQAAAGRLPPPPPPPRGSLVEAVTAAVVVALLLGVTDGLGTYCKNKITKPFKNIFFNIKHPEAQTQRFLIIVQSQYCQSQSQ